MRATPKEQNDAPQVGWTRLGRPAVLSRAKVRQMQEGRCRSGLGIDQRSRVGLPQLRVEGGISNWQGSLWDLRPADVRLTRTADPMKLSSKLFLLSADNTLHALASAAFMRMLRQGDLARVPDFAGQRVRQASLVVQVVDGTPLRMVSSTLQITR